MSEEQFYEKFVFNNFRLYTVRNPLTEDFKFKCTTDVGFDQVARRAVSETREYEVPAGGSQRFPGPVAGLYLDQMSKIKAQKDGNFGRIIDWDFRAGLYEALIADEEDLINNYRAFPQYEGSLDVGVTDDKSNGGDGTPFAEVKSGRAKKAA